MKKKIFSLLLIFTMFFGFAFTSQAQGEFVDDNTFVISNSTYVMNEEDAKELLLFFEDYVQLYNIPWVPGEADLKNISNVLHGRLYIDFIADLPSLDYTLLFHDTNSVLGLTMLDHDNEVVIKFAWDRSEDVLAIQGIATYPFEVIITLETPPPLTIFGFFKNFYSNYIFPNNLLDTQTLNLITAVTTLLFFIGVFRGIYSIFKSKRK